MLYWLQFLFLLHLQSIHVALISKPLLHTDQLQAISPSDIQYCSPTKYQALNIMDGGAGLFQPNGCETFNITSISSFPQKFEKQVRLLLLNFAQQFNLMQTLQKQFWPKQPKLGKIKKTNKQTENGVLKLETAVSIKKRKKKNPATTRIISPGKLFYL